MFGSTAVGVSEERQGVSHDPSRLKLSSVF